MKYRIREAQYDDAKEIARVHIQSWRETYKGIVDDDYLKSLALGKRTKKWQENLTNHNKDSWTFVAIDEEGKIVGFISGGTAREKFAKFKGEMYAVYVLKKHQKNKLGYRLTKKLCSMLKKIGIKNMYVCVLRDNESKNFYTKYGARLLKETKLKIGKNKLTEEYYGWRSIDNFLT